MGYRRLFIIRKDLNLSPGKLSAMLMHCVEAYYIGLIKPVIPIEMNLNAIGLPIREVAADSDDITHYKSTIYIPKEEYEQYIDGNFVKTVCEAKNKNKLLKAKDIANDLGLIEGRDYGIIADCCFTELEPEEENGTTIVGIWFRPLPDDIAHTISKKYQLYK
jgi:peptidyl-tRNA hydrolase